MESIRKLAARRIKEHRKRRRFTQASLAEAMSVDQSTIQRWEGGQTWPSPEDLGRLSAVLGVPAWQLIKPADSDLLTDRKREIIRLLSLPAIQDSKLGAILDWLQAEAELVGAIPPKDSGNVG